MSQDFHKKQRFFSIIELGSAPFIAGQGPPQFANGMVTSAPLVSARNVSIRNCVLGLSSHHGIHGNDIDGVTIENLIIKEFEAGGVALNGASNVLLQNLDIGPSLIQTFGAKLSHAIFMDHIVNTLMPNAVPSIASLMACTNVEIRGSNWTVEKRFAQLRADLQDFMVGSGGPLLSVMGSGSALPDG
ncbi:unnamed protein product [Prorocentrum cordatum]|uniref:Uncharacterized protein n=1 Tax=Prorocentrum cordatum TaxID=2364126 RepID=A0ABN9RY57_9DINO|nr:unnamed protein product [Polarella glacialis]